MFAVLQGSAGPELRDGRGEVELPQASGSPIHARIAQGCVPLFIESQ